MSKCVSYVFYMVLFLLCIFESYLISIIIIIIIIIETIKQTNKYQIFEQINAKTKRKQKYK